MGDRRELFELTRRLKQWLEWQGADGEMDVVPATREQRRAFRERMRERREAKAERIQSSIREGPPEPAAEAGADDEPKEGDADDAVWRELGSRRRGRRTGAEASGPGSQQPSDGSSDGEEPQTNEEKLAWLRDYLGDCRRCPLWKNRTNVVFGEGNAEARLVFVGEAPGRREDETGRPFVGRAGQLLNKMIGAMGIEREDVYICNVLKSRPPRNRDPSPEEIRECFPFLQKQLEIIDPEVVVTLGRPATQNLLGKEAPLGAMRGTWHEWNGIAVMPTYHPAYLLRSPGQKRKTWSDLQQVMERLELPRRGSGGA